MKKKYKKYLTTFNNLFSEPLIAAMTGFGIYFLYQINHWNTWASIIVSLYVSALVERILIKNERNPKA